MPNLCASHQGFMVWSADSVQIPDLKCSWKWVRLDFWSWLWLGFRIPTFKAWFNLDITMIGKRSIPSAGYFLLRGMWSWWLFWRVKSRLSPTKGVKTFPDVATMFCWWTIGTWLSYVRIPPTGSWCSKRKVSAWILRSWGVEQSSHRHPNCLVLCWDIIRARQDTCGPADTFLVKNSDDSPRSVVGGCAIMTLACPAKFQYYIERRAIVIAKSLSPLTIS